MPPKNKPLNELGSVEKDKNEYYAQVQHRDAAGHQIHIRGPNYYKGLQVGSAAGDLHLK